MIALAYSVLFGLVLASSASASKSDESSVYVLFREDSPAGSGCSSPGKFEFAGPIVGLRGFVLDEDYALLGGRSDDDTGTCAEEMACFVSPQSEACLSLGRTFDAYGEIIAQDVPNSSASLALPMDEETTNYYNCVRKTPSLSQCYQIGCGSSSLYPHCSFDIISPSDLASHLDTLLTPDTNDNNGIVFAAHYSDAACSTDSFVGVRGFLADGATGTQLPLLSGEADCAQSMACLLQPDSFACEVLTPLDVAEVTVGMLGFATPDDAIYQVCTVGDNGGSEKCQGISSGSCVQSPIYPSCYIRFL